MYQEVKKSTLREQGEAEYQTLIGKPLEEQIEMITKFLVNTLSVNGTVGEGKIANQIEALLQSFPYFKTYPNQVWTQPLPGDSFGRKNVFALVKGKGSSKKTLIYHAHMDTVDVKDFGQLEEIANEPDQLLSFFQEWEENQEIQNQALSGEWMFGRGCLDMKSGVAVHLANLLYFSEHLDSFDGNILFMSNPVEETSHEGVIAATDELLRLRHEEGLDFVMGINDDYTSSYYPGDSTKYIYTGAVGKVIASFYVFGRGTHVGETLKGLDPTMVTSELNRLINNNVELSEQVKDEMILPPCVLLQRDTKEVYNVQTPITSHIYFNYMIYERFPRDITKQLKDIAKQAAANTTQYYEKQFQLFLNNNGLPKSELSWELEVYTYQEYCRELESRGIQVKQIAEQVFLEWKGADIRTICFKIVDQLRKLDRTEKPCIIVFYAPPYVPRTYIKGETEREKQILSALNETAMLWTEKCGENFAIKRFFPYLSDSSYLSLLDTPEEIDSLIENFPEFKSFKMAPVDKIRELNIPAINIGVYGMDAHKWTERVYKPYSFSTLPLFIRDVTTSIL